MNRPTRNIPALIVRLIIAGFFLWLLFVFRAVFFPLFYLGLGGFLILGFIVSWRLSDKLAPIDAAVTFTALFLLPPGLISLSTASVVLPAALILGAIGFGIGYYSNRTLFRSLLVALWLVSLIGALGTINMLSSRRGNLKPSWAGEPITIDDYGWDDAIDSHVLASFPLRYKLPTMPEPIFVGEPPSGTVFGVLQKPDGAGLAVRPFRHSTPVDLTPSSFEVPGCAPLLDIGFFRARRQWLLLCGGIEQLVFYSATSEGYIGKIGSLGLWPRQMTVQQELERVYIVDPAQGQLQEFDLTVSEMLRTKFVGYGASDVAIGPFGRRLYIAMPYFGKVKVLDLNTLEEIDSVPAPFGLAYLETDLQQRVVYGVSLPAGKMIVIEAAKEKAEIIAKGNLGSPVLGLAFDPARRWLYWSTPIDHRWAPIGSLIGN